MDKERIEKLADFFYGSDSADDVPLRISAATGEFSGFDLSRKAFFELFDILATSHKLKEDLLDFRDRYERR